MSSSSCEGRVVTRSAVGAARPHPNLRPQIATLLLRLMRMCCRGAACSTQSSIRIQTHHSTATGTIAKASTARLWSCSGFIGSADPQPEQNTRQSGSEQPIKPSELERCGSHQAQCKQDCEAAKRHKSRVLRLETVRAKRIRQSKEPSHAQENGGLAQRRFGCLLGALQKANP